MKKSSALLLLFIAISVQHAFGCGEFRLFLLKKQSYEDENKRFTTSLKDSNGDLIEDIDFKITPDLVEFQCIFRRGIDYFGHGFSFVGGFPVHVKTPNASIEMEDSKASTENELINYYGASYIGELYFGGAVPNSSFTLGLALGAKIGAEYLTGKFDYTYDGSSLQAGEINDYINYLVEIYSGIKYQLFKYRKGNIFSIYLGKTFRIKTDSTTVVNNYDFGVAVAY